MSIEQDISDIKALLTQVLARMTSSPVQAEKPAEKKATKTKVTAKEVEKAVEHSGPTKEEIESGRKELQSLVMQIIRFSKREKAVEVIQSFGVKKISEMSPVDFPEAKEKLTAIVEEG